MSGLLIILTDASKLTLARTLALQLDPTAEQAFVPLVPAGTTDPNAAPSAYIANWDVVTDAQAAGAAALITQAVAAGEANAGDVHTYVWPCDVGAVLASLSLQTPVSTL